MKNRDNDLRMVHSFRPLNRINIPDGNPLPLINEALDYVTGPTNLSRIDLVGAYHQMGIKEEACHKTAIRTHFGSFEWRVLCFGWTDAPASFTRLLSKLLPERPAEYLILYFHDILFYRKYEKDPNSHLRQLFQVLRASKVYAKPSKCSIGVKTFNFLGYRVDAQGRYMPKRLMSAIFEWPVSNWRKEGQSFLGLGKYYRRFIKEFSKTVQAISDRLRDK